MPTLRLVTPDEVAVWGEALRRAALDTVDAAARAMSDVLAANGLSWGDPVSKTSVVLLHEATWARTVETEFVPKATAIAGTIFDVISSRFAKKPQAGLRDPRAAMTTIAIKRMLAGGVILNQRMTGGNRRKPPRITAAGNILSIRDALDDAAAALGELSARTGNQMANAAVSEIVTAADENATAAIMQSWWTMGDDRVRVQHEEMEGQERAAGEPFEDGDGNLLMYPGDPDAPDETVENCRCWLEVAAEASLFNPDGDYPRGGSLDAISSALDDALAELE